LTRIASSAMESLETASLQTNRTNTNAFNKPQHLSLSRQCRNLRRLLRDLVLYVFPSREQWRRLANDQYFTQLIAIATASANVIRQCCRISEASSRGRRTGKSLTFTAIHAARNRRGFQTDFVAYSNYSFSRCCFCRWSH